ncbi:MAG TPA: hypothetical protein VGS80_14880, partial [Ktedonobacterales bacterium]|nr:hypothetical protein [Ktedonobacterales bacterium]
QTLHQLGLSVDAFAGFVIAVRLLVLLGYGAVGAVLFWRASADRVALLVTLTLNLSPAGIYVPPGDSVPSGLVLPAEGLIFVGFVCIGLFFCIFPSGRFVPRWTPWLVLAWTAFRVGDAFSRYVPQANAHLPPPLFAISVCLVISLVAVQVYRYRRVSTPVQRQQTKWVLLGTALGAGYQVPLLVFAVLPPSVVPLSPLAADVGLVAGLLLLLPLPLGMGIALLRYRLFDVDVLIRRTLIYGSLTAILAAVYFGVVLAAQILGERLTGVTQPPAWVIVTTTLLVAALLVPLKRHLQAVIDRRFYRARYDATSTLQAFAASLRTETDLRALSADLLEVVQATLQPAHISLWLREAEKTPVDQRTVGSEWRRVR